MKTIVYQNREEWLEDRKGRITGSKVSGLIEKRAGSAKKIGWYELIADRLTVNIEKSEDPKDRGNRLEEEAIKAFMELTKIPVDTSLIMWQREDNENIAISPDGVISKTEAVEVKCLSSANHVKAYLTKEVPKEYEDQITQYFAVNDDLEKIYMVFYDPRLYGITLHYLVIERKDFAKKAKKYVEQEIELLKEIDEIVENITGIKI